MAVTYAGTVADAVIAFSRTGDPEAGEFSDAVVLYRAADVPDDAIAERTVGDKVAGQSALIPGRSELAFLANFGAQYAGLQCGQVQGEAR